MSHFPFAALKIFALPFWLSLFLLWFVYLWIILNLSYGVCGWIMFSKKLGKILAIISSNNFFLYSLLSFWHSCYVYIGVVSSVSHSLNVGLFFFTLFLLYSSDCIISINQHSSLLVISPACSNLLLSPSSEFYISIIKIFNSRTSFWF